MPEEQEVRHTCDGEHLWPVLPKVLLENLARAGPNRPGEAARRPPPVLRDGVPIEDQVKPLHAHNLHPLTYLCMHACRSRCQQHAVGHAQRQLPTVLHANHSMQAAGNRQVTRMRVWP